MINFTVVFLIAIIITLILFGIWLFRLGVKIGFFVALVVALFVVNVLLALMSDIGEKTAPSISSQPAQSNGANDAAR